MNGRPLEERTRDWMLEEGSMRAPASILPGAMEEIRREPRARRRGHFRPGWLASSLVSYAALSAVIAVGVAVGILAADLVRPGFDTGGQGGVATDAPSASPGATATPGGSGRLPALTVESFGLPGPAFGLASTEDAIWAAGFRTDSLERIDPVTGDVVDSIQTGTEPDSVVAAAGSLWVGHFGPDLVRVDRDTGTIEARIDAPLAQVAEGEGAIWLSTADAVLRVDPTSNEITDTIELSGARDGGWGIAVGEGAVWAGGPGRVDRIDPDTREIVATIPIDGWKLAVGAGSLWIGARDAVMRVDPDTNEVVAQIAFSGTESFAWDGRYLWAVGPCCPGSPAYLAQIDPAADALVSLTPLGDARPGAEGVTVGHGYVWASTHGDARLWRAPLERP